MATFEGAALEGRHFQTSEAKKHTLTDLVEGYRRAVLPHKHAATIPDQERQLRWWQTHLGHYLLADVTPVRMVEYRTILTHGRANATVVRYLAGLSHAFTMAVREWQWCEDNPARKVRKPREPRGRVLVLFEQVHLGVVLAAGSSGAVFHPPYDGMMDNKQEVYF